MKPSTSTELDRALERALIGGMLGAARSSDAVMADARGLVAEDFASNEMREAWLVLDELYAEGQSWSAVTVAARLAPRLSLGLDAAKRLVAGLLDELHVPEFTRQTARAVRAASGRRRLLGSAGLAVEEVRSGTLLEAASSLRAVADEASGLASAVEQSASVSDLPAMLRRYQAFVDADRAREMRTSWRVIDRNGGLLPGELVVLVARAKVGKSALLQNLFANVLRERPARICLCFSLEMPEAQWTERWIQVVCVKDRRWVREYYGDDPTLEALAVLPGVRLARPETATLETIREVAVETKRREGRLDLVGIDHADFLRLPEGKENLADKVRDLYIGLKRLAGELDVPIVILHQGSRAGGAGTEPPTATSARGSAGPEEVADLLLGAWRPGMEEEGAEARELHLRAIVARRMPPFSTVLDFDPETLVIVDASEEK